MAALQTFLFVSLDGMTDPLGQSQVLPYLTGLADKGYNIEIISCEKRHHFEATQQSINNLLAPYNIQWHYCFYKNAWPILSQSKNYFQLKKLAKARLKYHQGHVVLHCRSYLPAIIGLKLRQRYGTSFIFDMRGFWADERIDGRIWSKKNPLTRYLYNKFKRREKTLLQEADVIVSLTHKAKAMMLSWGLGISDDKIKVIPCCADLAHFSAANLLPNQLKTITGQLPDLAGRFVLSYIGSVGTWYMIDEMMAFFRELHHIRPAVFLIITKDNETLVQAAAKKAGLPPGSVVVRPATRAEVPYYISLSQLSVFFIRPSFSKQASSPTKMGELLSMGVPIITNRGIGDVESILEQEHCGVLVDDFSSESYTKAAGMALEQLNACRPHTIPTARKYFSLADGVEKYQAIYASFRGKIK